MTVAGAKKHQELYHIGVTGLRVDAAIYHHVYELAAAWQSMERKFWKTLRKTNSLPLKDVGLGDELITIPFLGFGLLSGAFWRSVRFLGG